MNTKILNPFDRTGQLLGPLFVAAVASTSSVFAAGAGAGIDASFVPLLGDLNTMLGGNFAALVLLISLIIGVAVYGFTSNWRWVISSVMIAFLIGYGIDIINGIGGVTATVDLLAASDMPPLPLDGAGPA